MSILDRISSYLNKPRNLASANQNTTQLRGKIANFRTAPGRPTVAQAWDSAWQNNLPARMASGAYFNNPKIDRITNPIVKPAGQMASGVISGLSLGFVDPAKNVKPTNRIEQGANITGNVLGIFNPLGAGNQILGRAGKVGTGIGRAITSSAGITGKGGSLIRNITGELAQTGTLLAASKAADREFNPVTDLAFGLGSRGTLGLAGRMIGKGVLNPRIPDLPASNLKGVNPKAFDLHPNDAEELGTIAEKIRTKTVLSKQDNDTLERSFKRLLPGYSLDTMSNKKIGDTIAAVLDRNFKAPVDQRSDFPAMGFVGDAPKRVEQTLKTEKFNLNTQQTETIKQLQKTLGLDTRTVRTFDDMKEAAEALGTDPQRLLREIENGRITDKEVIALGNVISTSSKRIGDLTTRIAKNPNDRQLSEQLRAEESLLNTALRKRIKGGTEAGRAVAAFRVIANKTMDRNYWLPKAKRQIDLPDDRDLPSDVVSAIEGYIKQNDRLGLARFVAQLGESTGWEKAITLWKAGLLTGAKTTIANVGSNVVFAGLETLKDIPATGFDIARSAVTGGQRTKSFGLRNLSAQPGGAIEGGKRLKALLKGEGDIDELAKAEIRRPIRFGKTRLGRFAQGYTEKVFGIVGGTDKPFFQMAFRRSLEDQAGAIKVNQKLDDQAVRKLVENPTAEMLATASKDAAYATFTNDNAASNAIRAFKQAGGPALSAFMDVAAPFTRTPTNVAKATFFDYTPLGLAGTTVSTIKKIVKKQPVNDRDVANAFGRGVTGTAALAIGAHLASQGLISGPSPSSEAERAQWELEGKTPNSILVNGKWRSMGRFSPAGGLLQLGAQWNESEGDVGQTAAAGLKGFTEQSFLKGLSSGLKGINEPDRFGSSFAEGVVSGSVPTLVSHVAQGIDTERRDADGMLERVLARVPGFRESLPTRLNSLGEPVKEEGGLINSLLDPANSRTPSDDPLIQEIGRVGYNLNYTGDLEINGETAERGIQREYQTLAGRYIRESVTPIINTPDYQNLSTDQQHSIIERIVNKSKDQAREEMKAKQPTISGGFNQAEAAEETEQKLTPLVVSFKEDLAKEQVKTTGKMQEINGKVIYPTDDGTGTIDLGQFDKKAEGFKKYTVEQDKLATARKIYGIEGIPDEKKASYYKKLGYESDDIEYDYMANQEVAVRAGFLTDTLTGAEPELIYQQLADLRRESLSGGRLASDGVLDELHGSGVITDAERKALKKIKTDAKGQLVAGSSKGGSGGGKKNKAAIAAAIGKLATTATQNQSIGPRKGNARVTQRSLGTAPRPSSRALVNAARIDSKADVDELIRRYSGR